MLKSRVLDTNKNNSPALKSELTPDDKDNLRKLKKKFKDF